MLTKVRESNIRRRAPFYIKYSLCGWTEYGETYEEVISKTNGWMYNTENDAIICCECASRDIIK